MKTMRRGLRGSVLAVAGSHQYGVGMRSGCELVGKRVRVYWDGDDEWFEGRATFFDRGTKRLRVAYDDNDVFYYTKDDARFQEYQVLG